MKKLSFSSRTIPFAFLAVVLLSYGIYISWFGFYGDDWIYIYNYHLLGSGSFGSFTAIDRPFSGWIYELTTPLFKDAAWMYHTLLLALRWGSVLLFWQLMKILWPENGRQVTWAALLFAVYPGFLQQPIAVQFILHFAILDLFLASLCCMLLALKHRRWYWPLTLAGMAGALGIFSLEYFAGLELLRPIFIGLVLSRQFPPPSRRTLSTLLAWLPYLLVFLVFGIWRTLVFKFPTYQPDMINGLLNSPAETVPVLVKRILLDLKTVVFGTWRQTIALPRDWGTLLPFALLAVVSFVLFFIYLNRLTTDDRVFSEEKGGFWREWPTQSFLVGVAALLVAGIPFWATSIRVELPFPWDRSTLPFMLGSCLIAVSLLEAIIQARFRVLLMAGLIALSIGFHCRNALVYKAERENLRTYFSQLVWRAPGLEAGTILVSDEIPLFRFSDNDLTPIVNWIYAPNYHDAQIPFKYFDLSTRIDSALPAIKEGVPVVHNYRNHKFTSSTSQVLTIYYQLSGCLYVLGPEDVGFPGLPETVLETLPISHVDQIITAARPVVTLPPALGGESSHDWCYYFEKADLARQQGDWKAISALATQAENLSLVRKKSIELLPFIEAFARNGEDERFQQYVDLALEDTRIEPVVCSRLQRIWNDGITTALLEKTIGEAGCNR